MSLPLVIAECAFANDPGDASFVWTPLSPRFRGMHTERGRNMELDEIETGKAVANLDNRDRGLDPSFSGSIVNLIKNPAPGVNSSDWFSNGSITSVLSPGGTPAPSGAPLVGKFTATLSTDTIAAPGGDTSGLRNGMVPGKTYTWSVLLYVPTGGGNWNIVIYDNDGSGYSGVQSSFVTAFNQWVLLSVTKTIRAGSTEAFVRVENGFPTIGNSVYIDAAQLEEGTSRSKYCDGNQDNCRWAGTPYNSQSYRGGPYYPNVVPVKPFRIRAGENFAPDPRNVANSGATGGYFAYTGSGGIPLGQALDAPSGLGSTSFEASVTPVGPVSYTLYPGGGAGVYYMQCVPGQTVYLHAWVKKVSGTLTDFNLCARYLDVLGTTYLNDVVAQQLIGPNIGQWYEMSTEVVVPATTAGGVPGWVAVSIVNGGTVGVPYVSRATGIQIATQRQAYVDAPYNLFRGDVEDWPQIWDPNSRDNKTEFNILDAFDPLKDVDVMIERNAELSGARINAILNYAGWPAAQRSIDTGQTMIQADLATTPVKALAALQQVALTESGIVFIDGAGNFVFQDRIRRLVPPYSVSQLTLSNVPLAGEFPFVEAQVDDSKQLIKNDVNVTIEGGATYTAQDAASIQHFRQRSYSITVLLNNPAEGDDLASWILSHYRNAQYRVAYVKIAPQMDDNLWAHALGRELGDRITVKVYPPGGGAVINQASIIERIEHDYEVGEWITTWHLSPADTQTYWIAGDPVASLAGVSTRAGY